jgi:hypothetical protein
MSVWSIIFFVLGALYLVGGLFEFPIMFEGNPKTRWLIEKMGKRNLKLLILAFGVIFIALAIILR